MHCVLIAGSPATASTTRRVLERCRALLVEAGGDATLLDLHEMGLPPMAVATYADRENLPDCVNDFTDQILAADAIVLGTPVHHGTFSGLLKGVLDHLSSGAFDRKPVGLVANVGGPRGGSAACEHLRAVVKALGGWAVPTQTVTHRSDFHGGALSPSIDRRLEQMVSELAWFSRLTFGAKAGPGQTGVQAPLAGVQAPLVRPDLVDVKGVAAPSSSGGERSVGDSAGFAMAVGSRRFESLGAAVPGNGARHLDRSNET
ncbi:MAG: NADPH-dependent FMN reductase [Dermatophilaceae bacterium]